MARKNDLKHVDAICRRYRALLPGDEVFAFRDYLHACKEGGDRGSGKNGDFTDTELIEKLKEYLGVEELP